LVIFLVVLIASLSYLVIKRRAFVLEPEFFAFLIACGFSVVVLASVNKELRFLFPVILALPFLLGVLLSGKGSSISLKSAMLASVLVFCCLALAALPTQHRADRQASIGRADAVLAEAIRCNDKNILLATDSPSLNEPLMKLSAAVTSSAPPLEIRSLAYSAVNNVPLENDFRTIQGSDLVALQDDDALSPPFTNLRVSDYRRFLEHQAVDVPIKVSDDVSVYSMQCRP
jgi:hypothetical protein